MSHLLDERYAVQPHILYLHSYDGKPLRELYPMWCTNYPQEFSVYAKEYRRGVEGNGKNCFDELRQAVQAETIDKLLETGLTQEDEVCRKLKAVVDGLLPISVFTVYTDEQKQEAIKEREIVAYGMYSALQCGMRLDFAPIIAKCRKIQVGLLAGGVEKENALRELDGLLLEVRQMNLLGGFLEAYANLSATCTNCLRGVTFQEAELENLNDYVKSAIAKMCAPLRYGQRQKMVAICNGKEGGSFRHMLNVIDKLTLKYLSKVNAVVCRALKKINAGKFSKWKGDGKIYDLTVTEPIAEIVAYVNGLTGREKVEKVEKALEKCVQKAFKRLGKWMASV